MLHGGRVGSLRVHGGSHGHGGDWIVCSHPSRWMGSFVVAVFVASAGGGRGKIEQ